MPTQLERDKVCDILYQQGFLTSDTIAWLTQQEAEELTRARKKQRSGHTGGAFEPPDIVARIANLHLPLAHQPGEVLTEELIMRTLAAAWGLPFQKIDPLKLDMEVVTSALPRAFAMRHLVMPLAVSEDRTTLTMAMTNPGDMETLDNVCKVTRMQVKPVISTRSDILKVITEFYGFKMSVNAAERSHGTAQSDLRNLEQYTRVQSVQDIQPTDRHVVNAVDFLFNYAFDQRASDIHIEPKREHSVIRLRIDGVLHDIHRMPRVVHPAMVSRIKTLARMDIAEKRRPQDGRIKVEHKGKHIELRISTLPVAFDEKIVMRIFDPDILLQDLSQLGFDPDEYELYKSFLTHTHGIILITGPTGSGKTTTLYSTLGILATPEVNVTTIEDPIEMVHEEFNQVAVQPAVGITFASALRTILRQDPDIIMVGEIRDYETAEHAIHAALTGHLVFSTLHTNSASASLDRLTDIGVPPYLSESTLIAIIAQRLVRTICSHCREPYQPDQDELATLGVTHRPATPPVFMRGKGCVHCRNSGYRGRTAIYEMMPIDDPIRELIRQQKGSREIKRAAQKAGMRTLRTNGIRKVFRGVTTVEEVLRVTGLE